MNIIDFIAEAARFFAGFNRVRIPVTAYGGGKFRSRLERGCPQKAKTAGKRKVLYSRRLTRYLENYDKD